MFGWFKAKTKFSQVIVAEIKALKPHPNADKLQLASVDTGQEVLEVVCGAWNIKAGDKVPLALLGAKLVNGWEIKEAIIRGVKSNGMLCAADELGLGTDHTGIIILSSAAKLGGSIDKYLK